MFFRVKGTLIILNQRAHGQITNPGSHCYRHRRPRSKHVGGENAAACLQNRWKQPTHPGCWGLGTCVFSFHSC